MRWPLLFLLPLGMAQAEVLERHESAASFPGAADNGWEAPWGLRGYPSSRGNQPGVVVEEGARDDAGGGWLNITSSDKEGSNGFCLYRPYTLPEGPVVISFQLRLDDLAAFMKEGENRIFIGESRSNSANTTKGTSWAITGAAHGPGAGGKGGNRADPVPGQWSVINGDPEVRAWVGTGIPLEEGVDYTFEITSDRASRTYTVTISANGQVYESGPLGFYSETPEPPILNFGQKYAPGTAATLRLGELRIAAREKP